ncbi:MAG: hypothetical protein ACREEB_19100 [Caulobacteraceae bacterium]
MFETLERVMTAQADTLKLRCAACGHQDEWTRDKALKTLGRDASPFILRHRLVCGECYARTGVEVWI